MNGSTISWTDFSSFEAAYLAALRGIKQAKLLYAQIKKTPLVYGYKSYPQGKNSLTVDKWVD